MNAKEFESQYSEVMGLRTAEFDSQNDLEFCIYDMYNGTEKSVFLRKPEVEELIAYLTEQVGGYGEVKWEDLEPGDSFIIIGARAHRVKIDGQWYAAYTNEYRPEVFEYEESYKLRKWEE